MTRWLFNGRDTPLKMIGIYVTVDQFTKWRRYEKQVGIENSSIRGFRIWKVQTRALIKAQPRVNVPRGLLALGVAAGLWALAAVLHLGGVGVAVFAVLIIATLFYALMNLMHRPPPSGGGGGDGSGGGGPSPRTGSDRPRAVFDWTTATQVTGPMTVAEGWRWINARTEAGDPRVFTIHYSDFPSLPGAEVVRYAKMVLAAAQSESTDEQRRTAKRLSALAGGQKGQVYEYAIVDLECPLGGLWAMMPESYRSLDEWMHYAEDLANKRGRQSRSRPRASGPQPSSASGQYRWSTPVISKSDRADLALLDLTEMPADAKELVSAMRKRAMKDHPERGGSAVKFTAMMDAYGRLLRFYPKEQAKGTSAKDKENMNRAAGL